MTIRPRRGGYQVIVYAGIDPVTGRQRQIARQVKGKREAERLEAKLRAEVADGRHQREEQARRARDRARRSPPPPCREQPPRPYCRTCGGHRGPHTVHHDQPTHERARRRYDGLCAKAASTGFPEEAAACRAEAEQLRAKYGL